MSDERLSRMEDRLDKLSEAVYATARKEERVLTVFKRLENIEGSIKKMDDRVDGDWKAGSDQRAKDRLCRTPVLDGRCQRRWPSVCIFEIVD